MNEHPNEINSHQEGRAMSFGPDGWVDAIPLWEGPEPTKPTHEEKVGRMLDATIKVLSNYDYLKLATQEQRLKLEEIAEGLHPTLSSSAIEEARAALRLLVKDEDGPVIQYAELALNRLESLSDGWLSGQGLKEKCRSIIEEYASKTPSSGEFDMLLACPFCGSDHVSESTGQHGDGTPFKYIECEECESMASTEMWNKRHKSPTQGTCAGGAQSQG